MYDWKFDITQQPVKKNIHTKKESYCKENLSAME